MDKARKSKTRVSSVSPTSKNKKDFKQQCIHMTKQWWKNDFSNSNTVSISDLVKSLKKLPLPNNPSLSSILLTIITQMIIPGRRKPTPVRIEEFIRFVLMFGGGPTLGFTDAINLVESDGRLKKIWLPLSSSEDNNLIKELKKIPSSSKTNTYFYLRPDFTSDSSGQLIFTLVTSDTKGWGFETIKISPTNQGKYKQSNQTGSHSFVDIFHKIFEKHQIEQQALVNFIMSSPNFSRFIPTIISDKSIRQSQSAPQWWTTPYGPSTIDSTMYDQILVDNHMRKSHCRETVAGSESDSDSDDDTDNYKYYLNQGRRAYNNKQYEASYDFFTKAHHLSPSNIVILNRRARTCIMLKKHTQAIQDTTKLLSISPNNALALSLRGYCHYILGQYREGKNDFLEAIKHDPNQDSVKGCQDLLKKCEIKLGNESNQKYPPKNETSFNRQHAHSSRDKNRKSSPDKRRRSVSPIADVVNPALAWVDKLVGRISGPVLDNTPSATINMGENKIERDKTSNNNYKKAREAMRNRKWDDAIALFTEIIKSNPNDTFSLNRRARCYTQIKKFDLALIDTEKSLSITLSPPAYAVHGWCMFHKGKYVLAKEDFVNSIKCDPKEEYVKGCRRMVQECDQALEVLAGIKAGPLDCSICSNAPYDTALIPCGHILCQTCCERIEKCPFCSIAITDKLKVFVP